jgi:hypothetical protein
MLTIQFPLVPKLLYPYSFYITSWCGQEKIIFYPFKNCEILCFLNVLAQETEIRRLSLTLQIEYSMQNQTPGNCSHNTI